VNKLARLLRCPERYVVHRPMLSAVMARDAWATAIDRYDRELTALTR